MTLLTFNMTEEVGAIPCCPVQQAIAGVGEVGRDHNLNNDFLEEVKLADSICYIMKLLTWLMGGSVLIWQM